MISRNKKRGLHSTRPTTDTCRCTAGMSLGMPPGRRGPARFQPPPRRQPGSAARRAAGRRPSEACNEEGFTSVTRLVHGSLRRILPGHQQFPSYTQL